MVKHENTIFDAYRRNEEKPSATWKFLKNEFPELSQTMTFNTFKQYVSVFSAIRRELDKVRQEAEIEQSKKIQNDKRKLMTELDNARKGLDEVRQKNSETVDQLNKTMQENSYLESKIQNLQDELDKVRQNKTGITDQLNKTIQEKFHLESKLENLNKELDKVRQTNIVVNLEKSKPEINPKNVMGWNVQQSKDGYYRCYRKINKQVHSIYIGKEFNLEKIRIRIREKENEINQCMTK
ncbi:MAG: hypothetical protein OMM_11773 [Candidatus Magnetoglobus multicellularis str. Araruama]|uniref:Uncharacterized protein n=1 Tax=Candidatus Magnetoglobus multicellularis str. Araruama TaxID=890399 RepID=A0A1V1NXN8_9BACT|nr:MAG: hypothetical protein OMM_11773 [Candidatus Magnetoglobus multicellularis str. Araruama]